MQEHCIWGVCFFQLTGQEPKLFGFAEYLAALALMVLAWTIADVRYRFRVRTAPIALNGLTFVVVAGVGFSTLLTDLWRAQKWYVPKGSLISSSEWQALLGLLLLVTFLMWAWFAFIRPSKFGKWNALRYVRAVYGAILKGDPLEMAIVADELTHSAHSIVKASPQWIRHNDDGVVKLSEQEQYAQDILLLLADRRFCRTVLRSPGIVLAIFEAVEETKKYHVPLQTFARNLINEAILDQDSFVYHEDEGYWSGLMGYHKPLSQAIVGNYAIVAALEIVLDPDLKPKRKWEAAEWQAYGRLTLMAFQGYVAQNAGRNHSTVFHRSFSNIARSCHDLYKINGSEVGYDDERRARLASAVGFIKEAVSVLDAADHSWVRRRIRDQRPIRRSVYDLIADSILELIQSASAVKSPRTLSWWVQHNSLWGEFFNFDHMSGDAAEIVKFKVRRLLYDEVKQMERFTNYQAAAVLGLLLNVMGLELSDGRYDRDSRALHKAILGWTKRNFAKIHNASPKLAEACLVDGLQFDQKNMRLARARALYPIEEPRYAYLDLTPVPAEAPSIASAGNSSVSAAK